MKIVINKCWGGFGLSQAGEQELGRRLGLTEEQSSMFYHDDVERNNPDLVAMIEENADLYSGNHAQLHVVDVPDDVQWFIDNYDGQEHVAEKHRTWG